MTEYTVGGDKKVATTAMGELVVAVGKADPNFVVTNADGSFLYFLSKVMVLDVEMFSSWSLLRYVCNFYGTCSSQGVLRIG